MDSISIAISGLNAQKTRLGASASNVANVQTPGYTPQEAALTPQNGKGVQAETVTRENAAVPSYQPSSPLADISGFVEMPDISYEEEAVTMMTAEAAYKANIAVIKTSEEMEDSLLDVLS